MDRVALALLLAPEIQEAVLLGKVRVGERALRRVACEVVWGRQVPLQASIA